MADVNDPTGEPRAENGRRDLPVDEPATGDRVADPAEERGATPTRRYDVVDQEQATEPATRTVAEEPDATPTAAHAVDQEPATEPATRTAAEEPDPTRTAAHAVDQEEPAGHTAVARPADAADEQAPPPAIPTRPIEPATEHAPPPPRSRGNRVVGTAWVLLAAGIFQVLFFAANALVALVFGGAAAVVPQLQSIAGTALAWLPVLLFFLLFELTVLLVNRAGRFAYVLMSLIVGAAVYIATVLLFSLIVRHTLGDANTLAQTFLNWEFILIGLVARETMLWTGLAIGSRGTRVRRRNKEARKRYEQELADARA